MTSNPEKPGLEPPPYDQAGGYPGAPPASAPQENSGAPPPQGYPGGPPPQGYPGGPPPQGYPGAPPPGVPLPQGNPVALPPGAPPPQGYPGAPPPGGGPAYPEMKQQYVPPQGGPPQQGVYPDLPAQGGYPGGPPVQGYPGGPPVQGYPGGPPVQGGYPGGPPQQVVQVGQPQPATVIISAPRVGKDPVTMECPSCRAHITTRIETDAGLLAWLVCGGMFLAGFFVGCTWFCCCIPFCSSNMQDTTHHCPACGHFIGKYKAAF